MTRFRNKDYLEWVSRRPCAACGAYSTEPPHHIKGRGGLSGASLKAPDSWTMPLCWKCHDALHRGDRALTNKQFEFVARTLAAFLEETAGALGNKTMGTLLKGLGN